MNVATDTFGSGVPNKCPSCVPSLEPLEFDVISFGWNAKNPN